MNTEVLADKAREQWRAVAAIQPFDGYKQSGHARARRMDSVLSYTQGKSAWLRLTA